MIANETLKIIKNRRSTRSFKEEQIKDEELQTVLEAGLYAPSAMNQQAWHFTVVQDKEILDAISYNSKEVAKQIDNEHIQNLANNDKFNVFYGAPTVVIVSGDENAFLIDADCAAATENMLIAAESIGLGSCWVNFSMFVFNGEKSEQCKQRLGIPAGFKPYYSVALGYKTVGAINAPARKENTINYIK